MININEREEWNKKWPISPEISHRMKTDKAIDILHDRTLHACENKNIIQYAKDSIDGWKYHGIQWIYIDEEDYEESLIGLQWDKLIKQAIKNVILAKTIYEKKQKIKSVMKKMRCDVLMALDNIENLNHPK